MLDLVVALRYDDHNRIPEGEISPRAGLVFKPKETQILRLTYNHAFSTPSSSNLYLDIRSSQDPFGIGAAFAPVLGFAPAIDIRAQGTYREDMGGGWTFARSGNGRPKFRSSFAPAAGMDPADFIDLGGSGLYQCDVGLRAWWGVERTQYTAFYGASGNPDRDIARARKSRGRGCRSAAIGRVRCVVA